MIAKLVKTALLTGIAYILQVTLAAHIAFDGVAPNLALAILSVITVGMGRKYTFLSSVTIGYLIEVMMPNLDFFSIILYPVSAMAGALIFADKSERKLEEDRTKGKRSLRLNAHIRTPLCTMLAVLVFEVTHLIYMNLSGVALNLNMVKRALIDIVYSGVASGILQFPIRLWLGIYRIKKAH